ncbi:transglycosylase domain-containing protein [Jonesia quinghaiensis]|uniref:transglycosylase domain-containing protein n=1 Tax=Jonesia quinghaiensis TaxID=262806 RepID=UPI000426FA26|nr:transglycosylase domain-containing protein [Jonesia quinghaiensis]
MPNSARDDQSTEQTPFSSSSTIKNTKPVNPFQVAGLITMFLGLSVIGGVLTAGLIVPFAAGASTATETAAETFYELPTELEIDEPSQASKIYARDGKTVLATYYSEYRLVVPLDDISEHMQNAVIATEDQRFWSHGGVDVRGVLRAARTNAQGGQAGGSTLTQQYVKNVLIHKASKEGDILAVEEAREGTIDRKLREAKLAINLEKTMPKEEILENYLNLAQFGSKVYGVETASNYYFDKSAKDLTVVEAATIAGVTQLPSTWDPSLNPDESQRRRNIVLGLMYQQGYITQDEYDEAIGTPLEDTLDVQPLHNGCEGAGYNGFFCDYVTKSIIQDPALGETEDERTAKLYRGGLNIITTLDPKKQKAAYRTVRDGMPRDNAYGFASAITSVEPGTGEILAMAQNRRYVPNATKSKTATSVNYSAGSDMGGSNGFQVGSTFKAFALAEWFKEGHTLRESVNADRKNWVSNQFKASCVAMGTDTWHPNNADGRAAGRISVQQATALSVNTAFAYMMSEMDLCAVADTAYDIGFRPTHPSANGEVKVFPSMVLGIQESSPLDMSAAYATFASGGTYCAPMAVTKVTDANGEELPIEGKNCRQTLNTDVANAMNYALGKVMQPGGGAAASALSGGRPSAGKTGTTNDNGSAWFIGYTPDLSTAIWMGNPDNQKIKMVNVTINGRFIPRVYGSTLAAPMWKKYMDEALEGEPNATFNTISPSMLGQVERPVVTERPSSDSSNDNGGDNSSGNSDRGNSGNNNSDGGGRGNSDDSGDDD